MGERVNYDWCIVKENNVAIAERAFEHIREQFANKTYPIDMLVEYQFSFENKDFYHRMRMNSKINYELEKPDGSLTTSYRGMTKVFDHDKECKVTNPAAHELFASNKPTVLFARGRHILSRNEPMKYEGESANKSSTQLQMMMDGAVVPTSIAGDTITRNKTYFSHTPHALRAPTLRKHKARAKEYQRLKKLIKPENSPEENQKYLDMIGKMSEGL